MAKSAKVKRITVSNLKAISDMEADFNGATAIVTGGNNMGKSSFLRSLPDRIRGIKPDVVLKFGEREGYAEWELTTGEKFVWTFDQTGREKLQFITKDDIRQSVSKEISQRYFPPVFDVDKFLQATPKKQREMLQELVGLDFTEIDKEYDAAFDRRTYANRRAKEERARVGEIKDLPEKEAPYTDLERELATIDIHNDRYKEAESRLKDHQSVYDSTEVRINDLMKEIERLKSEQIDRKNKMALAEAWLADSKNQPKDNADELKRKITRIKKQNEEIRKNNEARKQEKVAREAESTAEEADREVKKIEQRKMDMITNAKIPDGFSFTEDGIMYNKLPFTKEQLSSSGIYIAALKLANMTIGEVRTLHFDASFLDKKSLAEIEKWANKNKLQLLIELVDRDGEEITYELMS